jgi:quinol monooxygenase YgiN
MFCVVYEFEVIQANENEFKKVWHDLTLAIRETCGGLGSRLHKDVTRDNIWIAYAQWPNKNTWDQPFAFTDNKHMELQTQIKLICKCIRTVYQLEVTDDLLGVKCDNYI